jgi:hypothetical protein
MHKDPSLQDMRIWRYHLVLGLIGKGFEVLYPYEQISLFFFFLFFFFSKDLISSLGRNKEVSLSHLDFKELKLPLSMI